MEEVNALKVRNNLGEILDRLGRTGTPILISRGRKIRAVLVTPEDFKKRFLDVSTEEEKEKFLRELRSLAAKSREDLSSMDLLRQIRGYKS